MKKLLRLNEFPQLLHNADSPFDDSDFNSVLIDDLLAETVKKVFKFGDLDVVLTVNNHVYCVSSAELIFYCQFSSVPDFAMGVYSITQTMLWKKPNAAIGLTDFVFWDILMPMKKSVMSDRTQTESGKKLWSRLVNTALNDRKHVYQINVLTNSVSTIKNLSELDNAYSGYADGTNLRVLISLEEFKFKPVIKEYVTFLDKL